MTQRHGHAVKIIPAKAVTPYRQGHRTDENDALAVAEAVSRPSIKEAPLKTVGLQGLHAIQRYIRTRLLSEHRTLANRDESTY
jgi:transposase